MAGMQWKIQTEEKKKYDNIFDSLGPVADKLSGDKVKPVLLNSKLPTDILGQVWELSDIDKDGFLDREEFCVAMHLVYKALEHEPVPASLPPNLVPPSKQKKVPAGQVTLLPSIAATSIVSSAAAGNGSTASATHILSPTSNNSRPGSMLSKDLIPDVEYNRFSSIFGQKVGTDHHIAGPVARDVFVQSGLPQPVLAHVWNLCDQHQLGKLTQDQFILAMHFISQKVKGVEVPSHLPPEMLLPKTRDSGFGDSGNISDSSSGVGDFSAVRELDVLNREIEELRHEKETLTAEIREKQQVVRYRNNEVQELQNTLDRAGTSLSQLESDKAECHTRLDELDQQQLKLDGMLSDVRSKVHDETRTITSLQSQIKTQEMAIMKQEEEFSRVKNELESLKKEETQLQQTLDVGQQQLNNISKQVTEAEEEIVKVRDQIKMLAEQQKTVTSNIAQYDKAVTALKIETESSNVVVSGAAASTQNSKDDFGETNDLFASDNLFRDVPFATTSQFGAPSSKLATGGSDMSQSDPFAASEKHNNHIHDPFSDTHDPFTTSVNSFDTPGFESDPFGSADPFSSDATSAPIEKNEKPTKKTTDLFSANFFDQDNSVSLFNDTDQVSQNKTASEDPWAAFGSDATRAEDGIGADVFAKDAFVPSTPMSAFDSLRDDDPPGRERLNPKKNIKNMTEEAQVAWAAQESEQSEAERKEKLRIQEQLDLEYAIKLSKEL